MQLSHCHEAGCTCNLFYYHYFNFLIIGGLVEAAAGAAFGPADSLGVTLETGVMRFQVFMVFTNKVHAVRITQPSTTSTVLNMI